MNSDPTYTLSPKLTRKIVILYLDAQVLYNQLQELFQLYSINAIQKIFYPLNLFFFVT